jgi:hypothetical protein
MSEDQPKLHGTDEEKDDVEAHSPRNAEPKLHEPRAGAQDEDGPDVEAHSPRPMSPKLHSPRNQ